MLYLKFVVFVAVYGHFESAMRKYIEAIIVGSDYMTLPLNKPLIDDTLIRRMIKTCFNLGCNTQAAVLCQVIFILYILYILRTV